MHRFIIWLAGAGAGAGIAYLFDSFHGKRRRSLVRDQITHAINRSVAAADATCRDVGHRTYGAFAKLRSLGNRDDATDDVVVARVRSTMGHYVSHPSSIEVKSESGWITLRGPVLAAEKDALLAAVKSVRGVRGVEDRLDAHERAENIAALQGGNPPTGQPVEFMQTNWSPAARLAAGATGGALMVRCLRGGGLMSPILGTLGFGLLLRSLTNLETKRLFGIGSGRRGIDVEKTITIDSPVERVFALLSDPTSYPQFSDVILDTTETGDGRYRKTVAGPGGTKLTLEETITRAIPNELVTWRSEPSSAIHYAGRARFMPLGENKTRVQIQATYNPPGGLLSHSAAMLAGYDLKRQLDDLMLRAKSYLESGRQPHDAAQQLATTHLG